MGPAAPFDDGSPFTAKDWLRSGRPLDQLRRKDYVRVYRGIWVRRDRLTSDTRIRAALAIHPEPAIASHYSAGRAHGFPLPDHPFEHVMVFAPQDRRYRPEIKPHVATRPRKTVRVRGIAASDEIATFVDLAGYLGLVDLVIVGDWIVRRRPISPAQLVEGCQASPEHHAGAAAYAANFVRAGVDSPMETRVRMLIVLAGLPEPQVNHVERRADGSWLRRFDLYYPEVRLVVEYDGRHHAADPEQWRSDVERREEFDDEGIRILVVTSAGIYREPSRTLARIRRQLVLRGYGPVPPLSDAWTPYFAA